MVLWTYVTKIIQQKWGKDQNLIQLKLDPTLASEYLLWQER